MKDIFEMFLAAHPGYRAEGRAFLKAASNPGEDGLWAVKVAELSEGRGGDHLS